MTVEELEALLVEEQHARSEWARRAIAAEREVETLRRDLALARQGLRVVDAVERAEPPVEVTSTMAVAYSVEPNLTCEWGEEGAMRIKRRGS